MQSTGGHCDLKSTIDDNVRVIALLDDEEARINGEFKRLEERRREIRTERNCRQLVSCLPSEVLLEIFFILRSIGNESKLYTGRYRWDWLIITRVCRYWRDLALSTATLWNIIFQMYNSEMVEVFLERSKGIQIDIFYQHALPDRNSGIREIVRQNLDRVQKMHFKMILNVHGRGDTVKNWTTNPGSMPHLKELRVECNNTGLPEDWVPTTQLEVLELSYTGISWTHPIFRGLEVLILSQIYNAGPTIKDILSILEICSDLRKLHLDEVRMSGHNMEAGSRLVYLRSLRELMFSSYDVEDRDSYLVLIEKIQLELSDGDRFFVQLGGNRDQVRYLQKPLIFPLIPQSVCSLISKYDAHGQMIMLSISRMEATLEVCEDIAVRKLNNLGNVWAKPLYFSVISDFDKSTEESIKALFQQDCIRNISKLCLQFRRNLYGESINALTTDVWIQLFEAVPHLKRIEFLYGQVGLYDEDLKFMETFVTAFIEPKTTYIGLQNYHCSDVDEMLFAEVDFTIVPVEEVFLKFLNHLELRRDRNGYMLRKLWLASCKGTENILAKKPNASEIVHELCLEPLPKLIIYTPVI